MIVPVSALAVAAAFLSAPCLVGALSVADIPSDVPVSQLLSSAQSHLSRGETNEALVYYDAAIARDPTNYLTFFKRATTYLSLGRASQATQDFNQALSLKPGFEGAHVQLAKLKSRIADWDAASEHYKLAARGVDSPEVVELQEAQNAAKHAEAAVAQGDWDSCISYLSPAIALASRSASLREMRARCRLEKGELAEALGDLQHLVHIRPGDTAPYVTMSAISFYALGDLQNGLGYARKCLYSDPDSKACKTLLRIEKTIEKSFSKASAAIASGRPTTGIKLLVDSEDETGLVTDIEQETKSLKKDGYIPPNAQDLLHLQAVELTCQAYYESNSIKAQVWCQQALSRDQNSLYGQLHSAKEKMKSEEYEGAIRVLENIEKVHEDKRNIVRPLLDKARIALKRSKSKDYYKVLGVANDADERQIKAAYRKMTKQYHPDKVSRLGLSKQEAEKKMAAINEAYEVLSDAELRARFDRGDDPNDTQGQGSPFQGHPFGSQGFGGHPFFFHQQGDGGGAKFHYQFH